jgi:hypothetical protein
VRLARAPLVALSRISLTLQTMGVDCVFCGREPRGFEVALGFKPGPRDSFSICFRCADVVRYCIGPDRWWTCQACGVATRPGAALKRHAAAVEKFRFCSPCASKFCSLVLTSDLRRGEIEALEWEGRPT